MSFYWSSTGNRVWSSPKQVSTTHTMCSIPPCTTRYHASVQKVTENTTHCSSRLLYDKPDRDMSITFRVVDMLVCAWGLGTRGSNAECWSQYRTSPAQPTTHRPHYRRMPYAMCQMLNLCFGEKCLKAPIPKCL